MSVKGEQYMKDVQAVIQSNTRIADQVYELKLSVSDFPKAEPGQFVQAEIPGCFLRRPFSIAFADETEIILLYKTVGEGTAILSRMKEGVVLHVLGPLGTGFPVNKEDTLLIGGGMGLAPMYFMARKHASEQIPFKAVLGFASRKDVFYEEQFKTLGVPCFIATMDGTLGTKGTVLDAIRENSITEQYVLSCGPMGMLKALQKEYSRGCLSLEARMACGAGLCMGCVVKDKEGNALRVCKDGPVFPIGKVVL